MTRGHPVDAQGRVLPHSWWPADRQASGELEFVRRFCNSVNHENGAERFTNAGELDDWLVAEGWPPVNGSARDLARVVAVRDALRDAVLEAIVQPSHSAASLVAACGPIHFEPRAGHAVTVTPAGTPVEQLIGRLLLAVSASQADGTWRRLKGCQNCQWIVYDPSKNCSSRWCSMSACGGRHNARQYRRRLSQQSP